MSHVYHIIGTKTCSYCDEENDLLYDATIFGQGMHFEPMICKLHAGTITPTERALLNMKRGKILFQNQISKNETLNTLIIYVDDPHLQPGE